jgi:hypothetical protein
MLLTTVAWIAAAAQSPPLSVADVLSKSDALQKKGMLAMFSSDVGLIKAEAKLDLDAFGAELIAAAKAHRPLPACPPKVGDAFKFTFTSDEVLQFYRSIPLQRRSMSSKDGFAAFMAKKYPCSGS